MTPQAQNRPPLDIEDLWHFSVGLAYWELPLGERCEKDQPELFDAVLGALGLEQGDSSGPVPLRQFNPSPADHRYLLGVILDELAVLRSLTAETRYVRFDGNPIADEKDQVIAPDLVWNPDTNTFYPPPSPYVKTAMSYALRDPIDPETPEYASLDPEDKNFELIYAQALEGIGRHIESEIFIHENWRSVTECSVDDNVLDAFRRLYTPWIVPFLFDLAVRCVPSLKSCTTPFSVWQRLGAIASAKRQHAELTFFLCVAWYSLLDVRYPLKRRAEIATNNVADLTPASQVRERIKQLWPLRYLTSGEHYRLERKLPRLAETVDESLLRAIVTLGNPDLHITDRKKQDEAYDAVYRAIEQSETPDDVRQTLKTFVMESRSVTDCMEVALSKGARRVKDENDRRELGQRICGTTWRYVCNFETSRKVPMTKYLTAMLDGEVRTDRKQRQKQASRFTSDSKYSSTSDDHDLAVDAHLENGRSITSGAQLKPDAALSARDGRKRIARPIRNMPARRRRAYEVWCLAIAKGATETEANEAVAQELEISYESAKVAVARAREQARDEEEGSD